MAAPNESCEKIVLKEYILSGPPGEQGIQGPPGESVSFPIAAVNISVANAGFNNLQEVLDFLLYTPLYINEFRTSNNEYLFEKRLSTDPSADINISFVWSLSNSVVSQTFEGPIEMLALDPPLEVGDRSAIAQLRNWNTDRSFTLTADDGEGKSGSITSSTVWLRFANAIYFGDSTVPAGGLTNAWVLSNLPATVTQTYNLSTVSNTGNGDGNPLNDVYWWIATPVAYGEPYIQDGIQQVDMTLVETFTAGGGNQFVNALGHSEDYNLYRTTNPNLGDGLIINIT